MGMSIIQNTTQMPAEWSSHEATWLSWPHQINDWPGKFEPISWVYTEIIRYLTMSEKVHLIVPPSRMIPGFSLYKSSADNLIEIQGQSLVEEENAQLREIKDQLVRANVDLSQIRFFTIATNRCWVRDYGPIFVYNHEGRLEMTDWHFNAWAKYSDWQKDDAIPAQIADQLKIHSVQPEWNGKRIVLEGGSIDVNGEGLLLTTEECLLSPVQERNPGISKIELEKIFEQYLGIQEIIWLNMGIIGDDTHGHIDDLARFIAPNRVAYVDEDNPEDPNYSILKENEERLRGMRMKNGTSLELIRLPMPDPVIFSDQRLPASYANFYIGNNVILVPTFNDKKDRLALGILQECFPDRDVVGIHSLDLIWGLGTIHCLSQQQPISRKT